MDQKILKRLIIAVCGTAVVFLVISFFFVLISKDITKQDMVAFNNGWDVTVDGKEYKNVTMSEFSFAPTEDGEVVSLTNTIPEQTPDIASLQLLTYLSTIDIEVDGKMIYSYGYDKYEAKKLVGSGYHFVQLPRDCQGKTMTITLKATEEGAFTSISEMHIMDTANAITYFAEKNMPALFVSLFLFTLGSILTVISTFAVFYNRAYSRLIYIGAFSGTIGAWSMCNTKVIQIFTSDLAIDSTIEYVSLYLATIPFAFLIYDMRKDDAKWKEIVIKVDIVVLAMFVVIASILQFSNRIHFPETITVFHVLAALSLAILFGACIFKVPQFSLADKILTAGLVVMCVSVGLDLVRFNISKYLFPDKELLLNSVLPIGTLLFIVFMIISYLAYLYNMVMTKAEKDMLTKLAYQDSLTGLSNRAKCEEIFAKLDKGQDKYIIVNMDLNGLKFTNDTYGHASGDLLLTSFADILLECFDKFAMTVRMGGDEFLVIVKEKDNQKLMEAIQKMEKLEKEYSEKLGFMVETSYGVAHSFEAQNQGAEKVYQLADTRMYEMKVKLKKKRS